MANFLDDMTEKKLTELFQEVTKNSVLQQPSIVLARSPSDPLDIVFAVLYVCSTEQCCGARYRRLETVT